jgi:hypothetical protein
MYLITDLLRSTAASFELRMKPDKDAPPLPPPSCGTTLAKGARFNADNFGSYISRCAPLTSVTALDPPRRLTSSLSCEVAYPLLADWHAAHTDAATAADADTARATTRANIARTNTAQTNTARTKARSPRSLRGARHKRA